MDGGWEAYRNGDYATAFSQWKRLADKGYPEPAWEVAEMFLFALGVEQDREKATHYYAIAAVNGHGDAMFKLGTHFQSGIGVKKSRLQSLVWYMKAAKSPSTSARNRRAANSELETFFSVCGMSREDCRAMWEEAERLSRQ